NESESDIVRHPFRIGEWIAKSFLSRQASRQEEGCDEKAGQGCSRTLCDCAACTVQVGARNWAEGCRHRRAGSCSRFVSLRRGPRLRPGQTLGLRKAGSYGLSYWRQGVLELSVPQGSRWTAQRRYFGHTRNGAWR